MLLVTHMKTIKQIADEIGIDKQRVYRYIRRNDITEANQDAGTMYYDEAAETLIKEHFLKESVSDDANQTASEPYQDTITDTLIDMLKLELEFKNRQISEQQQTIRDLTSVITVKDNQILELTSSLNAAQALHAGTIQQQLTTEQFIKSNEQEPQAERKRRRWWQFWKADIAQE